MPNDVDLAAFLRSLFDGTRDGKVAWTSEGDVSLTAELGDGYSVTLRLEPKGSRTIGPLDRIMC